MKLKLLALLLALALLLMGCASGADRNDRSDRDDDDDERVEDREDEDEEDEEEDEDHSDGHSGFGGWGGQEESPDETEEEASGRVVDVLFEPVYDSGGEYALISGVDAEGELVWSTMTMVYEPTQLTQVTGIGLWNDRYYYVEGGAVVALGRETGAIIWENDDFGGCPANGDRACMILEDGTLYVTGYFGPDFIAIDKDGNTLVRLGTIHEDYYWPYELNLEGDLLTITMEGGPEGSWEYFVTLDTNTWEVVE